jgi:hypothetical protein
MLDNFDFLKSLTGNWQVRRILPEGILATGNAKFTLSISDPNSLHYSESIEAVAPETLTLQKFSKNYTFLYLKHQNKIIKNFYQDSWSELTFNFIDKPQICTSYRCGEDTYSATYEFLNDASFTLTYSVDGPYKNYQIDSTFHRIVMLQG